MERKSLSRNKKLKKNQFEKPKSGPALYGTIFPLSGRLCVSSLCLLV